MAEEKSLEELNEELEGVVKEHGEDSDEAKSIQEAIDKLNEEGKKFDYNYVKELREEAKKYRTDKAKYKKDYEKIQADLKKIEDAKLSDTEKDKNTIIELEKQLVDLQTEQKDKDIDNLILTVANGKNFNDMEIVKMLAKKELDSEEEVTKEAVEKIVDKLAKDKPYLVSSEGGVNPSLGNFSKKNNEPAKDANEMFGDFLHGE